MTHQYQAFGLTIDSELPLPELRPADGPADVTIRLGSVPHPDVPEPDPHGHTWVDASGATLYWDTVGAFRVQHGREIIVDPDPAGEEGFLRVFILGAALGVLQHQRGTLVLHASAVTIGDAAAVFIGWKGMGKSTTVAALHARGHQLLSDDVVAFDLREPAEPCVIPGFAQMKLWGDAAAAIGLDAGTLAPIHTDIPKWIYRPDAPPASEPVPLAAVFVLDRGDELAIEPLRPAEALIELTAQSYALRFLKNAGAGLLHFRQCESLARHIPVVRLRRVRSLAALPEVARAIEQFVDGVRCASR